MPWALFGYAQRKPPKTPLRRALWGVAVLLFCGALLPFVAVGAVQQWMAWDLPDAVFSTLLAVVMATGVGVAVYGFIPASELEAEGYGAYRDLFDKLNDRGETQNQEHAS